MLYVSNTPNVISNSENEDGFPGTMIPSVGLHLSTSLNIM